VTLSGNVKSEGQRRQIISAAERVVGKANVDNRLNGDTRDKTAGL
jgi:osmotically-inducible protein OsmY